LNGEDTYAAAVNSQGHVVGWTASYTSFLWKGAKLIDLRVGSPYSMVNLRSINDNDAMVGNAADAQGQWHAVHVANGRFIELESAVEDLQDWQFRNAIAINNLGVILGWGFRTSDQSIHYFKLVPVKQP
jgi:hypothetical protein